MTTTLLIGLTDAPGRHRRGSVAVMGQGGTHHFRPPAERSFRLMADLLIWVGSTRENPLAVLEQMNELQLVVSFLR